MLIGYARVSKDDGSQSTDLQLDALKDAGVDKSRIYQDTASGARADRPGLQECMRAVRPGDTLVVWRLDRLGRSLQQLVNTVDDLRRAEVNLRVLAGSGAVDTSDSIGKFMFHMFAALAEFERDVIRERTRAGLAAARARGRTGGRPPVPMGKIAMASELMRDPQASPKEIAKTVGISRATLYRYMDARGELKAAAKKLLVRQTKGRKRNRS